MQENFSSYRFTVVYASLSSQSHREMLRLEHRGGCDLGLMLSQVY